MKVFLQTRGRTTDYRFLGEAPNKQWWLDFRSFTSFEKPTLVVNSAGQNWSVYVSGIPSSRFDRVNTQIRYSLVLEGTSNDQAVNEVIKFVDAWVRDNAFPKERYLQTELDEGFPEEVVQRLLEDQSREAAVDTQGRLSAAITRVANAAPCLGQAKVQNQHPSSWVGAIGGRGCQAAFHDRVYTLLKGRAGAALMVNLVGNEEDARRVLDAHSEVAVLLVDPGPGFDSKGIVSLQKKKLRHADVRRRN